jgi:benzodiazapine receptor
MKKEGKNLWKLVVSILVVELVGILSSFATFSSIPNWYALLIKPSFNPPNWIFGPVWTILYLMIGISLYLVWTSRIKSDLKIKAYWIFAIQLALNGLWTIVFFGMHQILGALAIIILLWIFIILNIFAFYKISKPAAYLLIPYWLWVSFASILNFSIWMLNK